MFQRRLWYHLLDAPGPGAAQVEVLVTAPIPVTMVVDEDIIDAALLGPGHPPLRNPVPVFVRGF